MAILFFLIKDWLGFMKKYLTYLAAISITAGCATTQTAQRERGPGGTIAYKVPITSSEPGAQIEVNGDTVGTTPMTLTIYGDDDGTFHNFGSYDFIVRAYPPGANRLPQTKVFHTGALMAAEDKIPKEIFFDFGSKTNSSNQ
jgi:hypothetical protein